jgi:formate dehydrogenase major subunit
MHAVHELKDDGSTACGCWIYSGVLGPDDVNKAKRREARGPYGHGWGFAWPMDRRILYNRASAGPDGTPWSERKALVWWDPASGQWTGHDVPDFPANKRPDYRPPQGATGMDAHPGDAPFIMHDDGLGRLFVPEGLKDGPLPSHYEPLESPVRNEIYGQQSNPPAMRSSGARIRWRIPRPAPARAHHLPAHRAPHRGRHEPLPEPPAELQPEMRRSLRAGRGGQWPIDVITVLTRRAVEARALRPGAFGRSWSADG